MLVAALSKAGQGPHSAPATLEPPIGKIKFLLGIYEFVLLYKLTKKAWWTSYTKQSGNRISSNLLLP